jgi:hypothetical protein
MTDEKPLLVHGSIFYLLKKFVYSRFSVETWAKMQIAADVEGWEYVITKSYPLTHMEGLVFAASQFSGIEVEKLKEQFGEYLVPDLFVLYKNYVRPEWKTMDMIEHTEKVMHGAVRALNSTANPPVLFVTKVNPNLLIIDYHSRRRMGSLAIGIIRGIAAYYGESENVSVKSMSEPADERVQIRAEYS